MSNLSAIFIAIFLLIVNAFFVAGEFAVISIRKEQILSSNTKIGYKNVIHALENASLMLACTQLGITLASTGLGVIAEPAIAHFLTDPLHDIGLSEQYSHIFAFIIAIVFVVFMHVIFGEIIPKNISISLPEKAIFFLAPGLVFVSKILGPIVKILDNVSNKIIQVFGIEPKTEVINTYSIQEFAQILEESKAQGTFNDDDDLISGVIDFSSITAKEVMVTKDQVYTLTLPVKTIDIEQAAKETGYSRFVLVDKNNLFHSYIHIKDVLFSNEKDRYEYLANWRLRLLDTVYANTEIEDVLRIMQKSGSHIAKVVENDNIIGVVFLEDIIEELIGEIKDIMQLEE